MCNRVIDLIFVSDMLLQFVLITQTHSRSEGVKWIEQPEQIVRAYLRGWFALDFLSTLPSLADIVPLCVVRAGDDGGGASSGMVARLKALRVIRCTRLAKLSRLLRASRMLKRWETRISINYALLGLVRSLTCAPPPAAA